MSCPNVSQTLNYNLVPTDGLVAYNPNSPESPYIPVTLTFSPAFTITSSLIPLKNINTKPLFWVRDENSPNSNIPNIPNFTTFNTKFIILPNGNVGINTSNPRATFDVVQANSAIIDLPTAVFGKIVAGTQTQLIGGENGNTASGVYGYRTAQIMIYNRLASKVYNRAVVNDDQAILFTDGKNADGSNQNGCLVIAPWAQDYTSSSSTIGGLRINKLGNVDVFGELRATKMTVNSRWWSDNVFYNNYYLMPLDSVNTYIQQNGHLPGMPSEKEVLDSGINVSDIIALQQQKIEELTLHLISQQNSINKLLGELDRIKSTLSKD